MRDLAVHTSSRARCFWISVFVVYALALATATHWPNPVLIDAPLHSDKVIHFSAFFLWTLFLRATGMLRSSGRSLAILASLAMCYAILDELAQGLPGINRHVSAGDLLANLAGILTGVLLLTYVNKRRLHRGG